MTKANANPLHLERQLCFQVYLAAKAMVQLYQPLLAELDLTYPQYLVMLALWQDQQPRPKALSGPKLQRPNPRRPPIAQTALTVKELGARLQLDSGTLSPLLKRLEAKGVLRRRRDVADERSVRLDLTPQGEAMRTQAQSIPVGLLDALHLSAQDAAVLLSTLKALNTRISARNSGI